MCKHMESKVVTLKCYLCGQTFDTLEEKLNHLLEHRRVGEII